jgi:hypothetical protein
VCEVTSSLNCKHVIAFCRLESFCASPLPKIPSRWGEGQDPLDVGDLAGAFLGRRVQRVVDDLRHLAERGERLGVEAAEDLCATPSITSYASVKPTCACGGGDTDP